jgi:signal transduction histidine kinase/CheY-like chemotaxis protein
VLSSGPVTVRPDGTRLVDEAIDTPEGVRWYAWTETDVTGPDGVRPTLRSGREITDRIAAERALEAALAKAEAASEAKSRFLATVSHEFRTPLSGILGMSDLLLGTPLDGEQASYVQALRSSAEAFMSLVEEILDFSRIEAGRIDLADEPVNLEALVQGVVELLAPRAQDKGIEIAGYVAPDVPAELRGDRDRLRQILFNLAGNAVKFTSSGGVGIAVERDAAGVIVFSVEDTGPGIGPERLSHIFEEFDQGDLAAAREIGTGLGLAITRRIIDRMDGTIEVDSKVGRGSTFRVRLSLAPGEAEEAVGRDRLPAGYTALVVGATPFGTPFLARTLRRAGARVFEASTATAAAERLGAGGIDLVLTDWSLGQDSVRCVAAAARAAGTGRSIVLLSPFERRDFGRPDTADFDGYLIKPIRTRSLFERIRPDPPRAPNLAPAIRVPRLAARPKSRAPRVLLAEDNEVNALLAVKSLERLGALVVWAKDGNEALARAEDALCGRAPAFDLVLMDMRMPGRDGFEVTRLIREREAASGGDERCRIVALTASIVGSDGRLRETAGFDGFLSKPFTFEAIAKELGAWTGELAVAS